MSEFADLSLPKTLLKALQEAGYEQPYPIQEQAIPAIFAGKDILGIAKTGSGKTASYVLPILAKLQYNREYRNRHPQVLVLVPTRELAVQVGEVVEQFASALREPIKSMAVYGGVSINPQMIGMQGVRILIATPGRLLDLVSSKAVLLNEVGFLVLDEADKLLNLGFQKEVDEILKLLPPRRQNLLFSATLNEALQEIEKVVLRNPLVIRIDGEPEAEPLIQQAAWKVTPERKGPLLRYLIKDRDWQQVLVFTSSTFQADNVTGKLKKNGIEAMSIHSKKSQGARTNALQQFKAGKLRVLVATDLLARGIDIEFLPVVINYELPRSPKDYVHRIGRTGRAENPGEAIALITEAEMHHFKVIQKKMKTRVPLQDASVLDLHGF